MLAAQWMAEEWIPTHLANHPNITVLYRTVVIATQRDTTTGNIVSVTAIQRTPTDPGEVGLGVRFCHHVV